jgi:iron complex transport system permease protein
MRPGVFILLLFILLPAMCMLAAGWGSYQLSASEIWKILTEGFSNNSPSDPKGYYVLWKLRFPRILMAILVGAALGMAGTTMQGLFRNPLVSPGLIGISAGATTLTALAFVFGGVWIGKWSGFFGGMGIASIGFTGAMLTLLLAWNLAGKAKGNPTLNLILTGIAITALAEAVVGLSQYVATETQLRAILHWQLGSLSGATYPKILVLFCVIGPASFLLWKQIPGLNALALGEENAMALGIYINKLRKNVLTGAALLVGSTVAFTGIIAFIGLVVPHLVRMVTGPDHRYVFPGAALMGANLLLAADTLARNLAPNQEVPISILTAVMGAPFLLYLILRNSEKHA